MGKQTQAKVRGAKAVRTMDDERAIQFYERMDELKNSLKEMLKRDDALDLITGGAFMKRMGEIKTQVAYLNQRCLREMGTYKSRQGGISSSEYARIMNNPESIGFESLIRMTERIQTAQKKIDQKRK
jgi:mevalonate kinase